MRVKNLGSISFMYSKNYLNIMKIECPSECKFDNMVKFC